MNITRRHFMKSALGSGTLGLTACSPAIRSVFNTGAVRPLPIGARSFARQCFDGLDRSKLWDVHVHVMGNGKSGSGCYINPAYSESAYKSVLKDIYLGAGGVKDDESADLAYTDRLLRLHRLANPYGKLVILAFDYRVNGKGEELISESEIHTPTEWVLKLAKEHGDLLAGASIHPYRADALDLLDAAADQGAVVVKWLPNAMGIDPASKRCDAFYQKMADRGLWLITHGGEERAVDSRETQDYGNVLRLRRGLDLGCRMIIAHSAGMGSNVDLDQPQSDQKEMKSFDLFRRLLSEKQYENNLMADISAMTQFNRSGRSLRETIKDSSFHHRLLNGSDFPLPGLRFLVSTQVLQKRGLLSPEDREHCNVIFEHNQLLFDFVVKRRLRVQEDGREYRLSPIIFETSRIFDHLV